MKTFHAGAATLTDADCAQFGVTRRHWPRRGHAQHCENRSFQRRLGKGLHAKRLQTCAPPTGRIGWELPLVVQGGLCILDQVEAQAGRSLHTRQTLRKTDAPRLLWNALGCRPQHLNQGCTIEKTGLSRFLMGECAAQI